MNVGVLLHVGLLVEPLSAVLARVRPRVRVDEEVRGERGAPLERLAALLARERPLVRVHRPARKEISFGKKVISLPDPNSATITDPHCTGYSEKYRLGCVNLPLAQW